MSNALAIATVTETLLRVLSDSLSGSGVTGAKVTATRPDDRTNLPISTGGVNIFLYQVSPNAALRNADLPTRKRDGTPVHRPQVALDLHYLLTFYGEDLSLDQQRLLGCVVRQLHAHPALHNTDIVSAQNKVAFLAGSNLSTQVELIKFTPVNFSLEELSKLWSVFLKTDYVLSVAYRASVVLIETDDLAPATALPVLRPCLTAIPFSLTVINSVQPQAVDLASPPGATLITLNGLNLDPADAVAFLTPGVPEPIAGTVAGSQPDGSQLTVDLPEGLRPGVNTVTLTRYSNVSPPGLGARIVSQSNAAAFILRPGAEFLDLSPPSVEISARIFPAVGPSQQVSLLLNQIDASPPATPKAFQLPGVADPNLPGVFDFATRFTPVGSQQAVTVPPGVYLARVRVDAAESLLTVDASGTFNGPTITIP